MRKFVAVLVELMATRVRSSSVTYEVALVIVASSSVTSVELQCSANANHRICLSVSLSLCLIHKHSNAACAEVCNGFVVGSFGAYLALVRGAAAHLDYNLSHTLPQFMKLTIDWHCFR